MLKYFNHKTSSKAVSLPNENGPLAQHIPSSSIQETNKEVSAVMVETSCGRKRSTYLKASAEKRARIGKYAAEHGIVSAIRQFSKDFPVNALKESTVRGWKMAYTTEVKRRIKAGEDAIIKAF